MREWSSVSVTGSLFNSVYIWKLFNKYRSQFPKVEGACDQGEKCAVKLKLNRPFSEQTCQTQV